MVFDPIFFRVFLFFYPGNHIQSLKVLVQKNWQATRNVQHCKVEQEGWEKGKSPCSKVRQFQSGFFSMSVSCRQAVDFRIDSSRYNLEKTQLVLKKCSVSYTAILCLSQHLVERYLHLFGQILYILINWTRKTSLLRLTDISSSPFCLSGSNFISIFLPLLRFSI